MRPAALFLASFLAISTSAQLPIPLALLAERPVASAEVKPAAFEGRSSVASNGLTFLVATTQDGFFGYATRNGFMVVDAEGRPLLEASHLFDGCGTVDVASDGRGYLAVNGCLGATSGVLVDGDAFRSIAIHEPTRIPNFPHNTGWRGVAWDGQQYVVLTTVEKFDELRLRTSVVATRITSRGAILQNDIDLGAGYALAIAARNGVTVSATWMDGIALRAMNAAGVVSPPRQVTDRTAGLVEIAAGDDGFLAVWNDPDAVRAQHLDAGGNPDATPFTIVAGAISGIAVVAEGSGYRVAWSGADESIRSTLVLPGGSSTAAEVIAAGRLPALASNGIGALLVWASASHETRARRLEADGEGWLVHRVRSRQSLDAFTLSASGPALAWSELDDAYNATSHLERGGQHLALPSTQERFAYLRGLDRPLIIDPAGPPWSVRFLDDSLRTLSLPSKKLFWTGDAILALWTDPASESDPAVVRTLWAQRFGLDGVPLDPAPISIGTSFDLDAAFSGPAALYNGVFAGASADEVLIAYVAPNASLQGVILKNGTALAVGEIASPQALADPIEITSDGRDFLVTWISNKESVHSYIGSRRVLAGGAMPEPMHVQSTAGDRKDAMATFWTGENYLVVWSTIVDAGRELWALRITRDGKLIDYPAQKIGTFDGTSPKWSYSRGLLAEAYERDGSIYWRYVANARRRAAR